MLAKRQWLIDDEYTNELTEYATSLFERSPEEVGLNICCYLCNTNMHESELQKYGDGLVVCLRYPGFTIGHFYIDKKGKILDFVCYERNAYKIPKVGWKKFAELVMDKFGEETIEY